MDGPGEDATIIGYLLKKPCIANLKTNPENEDSYKINLFPWIPLSKDTDVPVPRDYVITILNPIEKLDEIYKRDIFNPAEESTSNMSDLVPTIITPDTVNK
jgi:hypothetical protein